VRKSKEQNHLENLCVDGRIILRWILGKWDLRACTDLMWLRIGTVGGNGWLRY
jgi:hypothetical protein